MAHTPSSRLLAVSEREFPDKVRLATEDPRTDGVADVRSWVGVRTQETGPAAFGLVAAAKRWHPDSQELEESAFSHTHADGRLSRFDILTLPCNKHREIRFEKLMRALQSTEPYDLKHTVLGYRWQDLGPGALVVDVGGSTGATAQALVAHYSNMHVIVQEYVFVTSPSMPSSFSLVCRVSLSKALRNFRGTWMIGSLSCPTTYSIKCSLSPQQQRTVFGRFSMIGTSPLTRESTCRRISYMHRPDKYAQKALRNTAQIMQPGQRVIIVDVVMPPPGSMLSQLERQLRRSDLEMLVQFNALEREIDDWVKLIRQADSRLSIQSITKPLGSANTIIEAAIC